MTRCCHVLAHQPAFLRETRADFALEKTSEVVVSGLYHSVNEGNVGYCV